MGGYGHGDRSSAYPEYEKITIPVPDEDYDRTMALLETLGIGDVLAQDCCVVGGPLSWAGWKVR